MRATPTEAWILAREDMRPALGDDVCGMPHVLRIAADLAHAGAKKIFVIWRGAASAASAAPSIADLSTDSRLKGAELSVVTSPPIGVTDDPLLVVRADRIYHRDIPKLCVRAWRDGSASLAKVAGDEYDAVVVTSRDGARRLLDTWTLTGTGEPPTTAEPPYLGFTVPVPDARAHRRAEKLLVWSLRKQAQGIAAYWINRHISLPVTRAICRTNIIPNQVTVFCFLLALTGGIVIGQGGYWAGLAGMALVNLGSILDGVDGELARLKYRFSHIGAWLDTLADDFGNVAYISGIAVNLHKAGGPSWAVPLAATALVCFALTQSTQYFLITKVYRSGDLAAIPWAFQSNDFLTTQPEGFIEWLKVTLPKTLKRDFALTMFVVFAALGHLEWILVVFSAGAIVFFVVFAIQFLRNLGSVREAASRSEIR